MNNLDDYADEDIRSLTGDSPNSLLIGLIKDLDKQKTFNDALLGIVKTLADRIYLLESTAQGKPN